MKLTEAISSVVNEIKSQKGGKEVALFLMLAGVPITAFQTTFFDIWDYFKNVLVLEVLVVLCVVTLSAPTFGIIVGYRYFSSNNNVPDWLLYVAAFLGFALIFMVSKSPVYESELVREILDCLFKACPSHFD